MRENLIVYKEFAEGSMLPKVEACLKFVKNTNKKAIITSLDKALDAINGKNGTVFCSKKEVNEMAEKKKTAKQKNLKFGMNVQ